MGLGFIGFLRSRTFHDLGLSKLNLESQTVRLLKFWDDLNSFEGAYSKYVERLGV